MSTYFLLDPFEFPYYFYCILGELIYVLSIVACIPSTFCPTLGHHQGRIYYKSDVTFVLAYYNCVRASLPLKVLAFVFECESTRDTCNYGQYINQFPQNTIKVIREFERIQKKICRHKMSIMFNEICINEEMLPKYTYIYIYTHQLASVMLRAQCWVTTRFIFVCQLDTSWGHWTSKWCYYLFLFILHVRAVTSTGEMLIQEHSTFSKLQDWSLNIVELLNIPLVNSLVETERYLLLKEENYLWHIGRFHRARCNLILYPRQIFYIIRATLLLYTAQ